MWEEATEGSCSELGSGDFYLSPYPFLLSFISMVISLFSTLPDRVATSPDLPDTIGKAVVRSGLETRGKCRSEWVFGACVDPTLYLF